MSRAGSEYFFLQGRIFILGLCIVVVAVVVVVVVIGGSALISDVQDNDSY
jgi:hypothetical protein